MARPRSSGRTGVLDGLARVLGLAEERPKGRGRGGAKGRGRARKKGRGGRSQGLRLDLIGIDVGHAREGLSAGRVLPALALALAVALGLASLRVDMIRLRYALAETSLEENRLLEEQRSLTADKLRLRDPVHLAGRAQELGFVRPERLIDLPAVTRQPGSRGQTVLASADAATPVSLDRP